MPKQQPRTDAELLTIPETKLRLKCSENHVYNLITAGVLPAVDIAPPGSQRTKMRVHPDDLADYIDSLRTTSTRSKIPARRLALGLSGEVQQELAAAPRQEDRR